MAKKRKMATEKPPTEATVRGVNGIDEKSSNVNSTMKTVENQGNSGERGTDGDAKGRHFWYVVYPSEAYFHEMHPDGTYDGANGWGTMEEGWEQALVETGLAFEVSELHWLDVNPDGRLQKKPHWHVIVTWPNTTTYRAAQDLGQRVLNSPAPVLLHSVVGAHRYHRHLDNPEKYQYATYGVAYNGWRVPLQTDDVARIKAEIRNIVLLEDVQEYMELLIVCEGYGAEYHDVAINNTLYCERLCSSYRHNPVRNLMRYYDSLPDGELKDEIGRRVDFMATPRDGKKGQ